MKNNPYHEDRPWGWFKIFAKNEECTVKILHVRAGGLLSLQKHSKREEYWRVLSGDPRIIIDGVERVGVLGDEFEVRAGSIHRIVGGSEDAEILEVGRGHFDEADIVRYEDAYGRETK